MVKQEIRSLVRNLLPRADKQNRWHDNVINAAIEKALASLMEDIWEANPINLQRYTKGFGYTTPVQVQIESGTGIYYSTLPSIIPFQDKMSGVRRISTVIQGGFNFFPMDFREMDLISDGCYFDTVNTKIGYAVNQTRVEYYGMTSAVQNAGVRMDLIIPFSKYDEDDEVKVPEITAITGTNYQKKSETFIDRVMAIIGITPNVDLKDDNSQSQQVQRDN
jgi:hypothetical protein